MGRSVPYPRESRRGMREGMSLLTNSGRSEGVFLLNLPNCITDVQAGALRMNRGLLHRTHRSNYFETPEIAPSQS